MAKRFTTLLLVLAMTQIGYASMEADFGLPTDQTANNPQPSTAQQTAVFNGDPVQVILSRGVERRIIFEDVVEIGMPAELAKSDEFNLEIYGNSLLITASRVGNSRVVVNHTSNALRYPLDLKVIPDSIALGPLKIITGIVPQKEQEGQNTDLPVVTQSYVPPLNHSRSKPGVVDLVRFAAQQFYAPERLVEVPAGAKSIPVINESVRLIRYQSATTKPMASWQVGGLFVTAVEVTNNLDRSLVLDPRHLVGQWRAATFHQHILAPKASPLDLTMLYLVSDRSFEDALRIKKPLHSSTSNKTDNTPDQQDK